MPVLLLQRHTFFKLLLLALACLPLLAYAGPAARVEFSVGASFVIDAAKVERALSKGMGVNGGETIRTADGAMVQLRFSDGALLTLRANTEFRIDDYRFNGKADGSEKGFFSLIKGGLRTITGLIGKATRENYRIQTAVATVGIRGTEFSLLFSGGVDGTLEISTASGAVEVANGAGCLVVAAGGSASVRGAGGSPSGSGGSFGSCNAMPDTLPLQPTVPLPRDTPEPSTSTPPASRMPSGMTGMPSTAPSRGAK